jgi:hypothetical protein
MRGELSDRDQAIIAAALAGALRREARRQRSRTAAIRSQNEVMRSHLRRQWRRTAAAPSP